MKPIISLIRKLEIDIYTNRILLGKLLIIENSKKNVKSLEDVEFKIFSQWGEDGIIQYLISKIPIKNKIFVEFGVEDYREANTRFLLVNNNWSGVVIDSNADYIKKIKSEDIYWRYDLKAIHAFITKDNINDLLLNAGLSGDIGLLRIDIDGNDYWVWNEINCISPRIVICEYNSLFGNKYAITIPYDAYFNRTKAHYSNLYFGASLKALCLLAEQKGYCFIGSNSAACNAFFVRNDFKNFVKDIIGEAKYVESKARESRDKFGKLTFISGKDRIKLISHLKVIDFINMQEKSINELDIF
jgi:hypothetical protein